MAKKNFTIKNHNGTGWDDLYPKTSMEQVEGLNSKIGEVEAVAKGASRAFVFDTVAALDTWLGVAANKATLQKGDNLYIRATDVPDYWWDGTAKQPLETEKVVFTNASQTADGMMSKADKTKLDGVATGANNYAHPANHPASVITQDASNRFVTDTEKSAWNAKSGTAVATQSANGLMASGDKTKLDGLPMITVSATASTSAKIGDLWYDLGNS